MIRNAYSVLKGLPDYTSADDGEADVERVKRVVRALQRQGHHQRRRPRGEHGGACGSIAASATAAS